MIRRVTHLLIVYALLGAAAALAVAYGCWASLSLSAAPSQMYRPSDPGNVPLQAMTPLVLGGHRCGASWWLVLREAGDPDEGEEIQTYVPRWTGLWPRDWHHLEESNPGRMVAAYGWPRLALCGERVPDPFQLGIRGEPPLRPIWSGVFIDSLVFAGAFALAHQGSLMGRRWWRRGRGRCPVCAYDLTGLTGPCPECGKEREA
jgi:hypothetical protein